LVGLQNIEDDSNKKVLVLKTTVYWDDLVKCHGDISEDVDELPGPGTTLSWFVSIKTKCYKRSDKTYCQLFQKGQQPKVICNPVCQFMISVSWCRVTNRHENNCIAHNTAIPEIDDELRLPETESNFNQLSPTLQTFWANYVRRWKKNSIVPFIHQIRAV
jgi:hypothetical protein